MNKSNKIPPSSTTRQQASWLDKFAEQHDIPVAHAVRQGLRLLFENGTDEIIEFKTNEPLDTRIPMFLVEPELAEQVDTLAQSWGARKRAAVIRTAIQALIIHEGDASNGNK